MRRKAAPDGYTHRMQGAYQPDGGYAADSARLASSMSNLCSLVYRAGESGVSGWPDCYAELYAEMLDPRILAARGVYLPV